MAVKNYYLIVVLACCLYSTVFSLPVKSQDKRSSLFDFPTVFPTLFPTRPPSTEAPTTSTTDIDSFHVQLSSNTLLGLNSTTYILADLSITKPTQFLGSSLNATSGTLTASSTGVYLFSAAVQMTVSNTSNITGSVSVGVCPSGGNCLENVESSPLLHKLQVLAPGNFTVSVTGILKIQAGTTVNFILEKAGPFPVTIDSTTTCSGLLVLKQ